MAGEFLYWSDLLGSPVLVAGQGRQAGKLEDFYYDPETQSITALRAKTSLHGSRVLLTSAIAALDRDGVTIANEHMLIDETNAGHIYQLPLGHGLIGSHVITERGRDLGTIGALVLGVYPIVALRISAFEIGRQHGQRISAHAIISINEGTVTIMEQEVS